MALVMLTGNPMGRQSTLRSKCLVTVLASAGIAHLIKSDMIAFDVSTEEVRA
jgi:hypothetical protein